MQGRCRKRRVCTLFPHLYFSFAVLLLFSLLPLHTAQATIITWTNSNGIGNGFYWQNGGSNKGFFSSPTLNTTEDTLHFSPTLFGSPTLNTGEDTLQFPPQTQSFCAESINDKNALTSDCLQIDIIADRPISSIQITESGDYVFNSDNRPVIPIVINSCASHV